MTSTFDILINELLLISNIYIYIYKTIVLCQNNSLYNRLLIYSYDDAETANGPHQVL